MSDNPSSEHSSDPDFEPEKSISENLTVVTPRQTRLRAKYSKRSKSLNDNRSHNKGILEQSTTLVGSTETISDTTSNLLKECKNILDITNPPLLLQENQENQEHQENQENQEHQQNQVNSKTSTNQKSITDYYTTHKIDWSKDQIVYENYPSTCSLIRQDIVEMTNEYLN